MPRIKGTASQEILHTLLVGGALLIAGQSPYFWLNLYKRLFQGKPIREPQVRDAFRYLQKRRLVFFEKHGKQVYLRLTPEGEKEAEKFQINKLAISVPSKWDGRWRLIIFDIPEKKRIKRESFRGKLKEMGFRRLQKSIWVYPYPCEKEVKLLREFFNLTHQNIRILEIEKLEEDTFLRRIFKLGI
jgi:CRISPR-associated endonuclease Cas2